MPPDKSAYWETVFSSETYVVGTQKNRLNVVINFNFLLALHYSVDFIFLSFGIMGFIVEL